MIGGLEMGIKDDCRNAHSRQSSGVVCSTCLGHGCPHDSAARRGSCRPRRRHKARQGPSQRPAASTRWSACGAVGRLEGSGEVHSSISVSTPCRQARTTGAVSDEPPPAPGGHMGWVVAPCFCQASRQAWHGMDPCAQHCPPGWLPTPVPMAHLGAVSRHAPPLGPTELSLLPLARACMRPRSATEARRSSLSSTLLQAEEEAEKQRGHEGEYTGRHRGLVCCA